VETTRDAAAEFSAEGGRFSVQHTLGRGAFGVVFAVEDRDQHATVAAKLLHNDRPQALARFKREFRGLADLHHPNLVRLYELHAEGAHWFFTMERVHGKDPLTWLAGATSTGTKLEPTVSQLSAANVYDAEPSATQQPQPPSVGPGDIEQVRSIFAQIACGLQALHDAQLLHRDLKPANILVDDAGRVKLLDFGLIQALSEATDDHGGHAGTPAYMAPELWTNAAPTPAADWFSMGVTLHQALTGQLPPRAANGAPQADAFPRATTAPHEALTQLCRELLAPDPQERPQGFDVLERLGAGTSASAVWGASQSQALVGRERETQRLESLLDECRDGGSRAVVVRGASGMGKSALAKDFCRRAHADGALVLAGRCYQQEVVPFKALDGVVDTLAQRLCGTHREDPGVQRTLDRYGAALGRVFEVLRMVPDVGDAGRAPALAEDHDVRRHAFEGLAALLMALAATQPVIVFIDDLQWGDAESAERLAAVMALPSASGVLLLGTCRAEETETPFFTSWSATQHGQHEHGQWHDIDLAPLEPAVCEALALSLLADDAADNAAARGIARECGGSPFFIEELVQHAARIRVGEASPRVNLFDAVHARINALENDEQRLLELVAIAGQPIALTPLSRAAGLKQATYAVVDTLRAAHLARTRQVGETLLVESYHDAVRETVLKTMEDVSGGHRRLGDAMEAVGFTDRGRIARHMVAGEAPARAVPHAIAAAQSAAAGLAFERAAELWKLAAESVRPDDPQRQSLTRKRAAALVQCGRGTEAAPLFERLVSNGGNEEDLRSASEQWLTSGHFDRGSAVLRRLLTRDGLSWPGGLGSTLAAVFRDLLLVVLRRGRTKPPPYDASRLAQVDTCWAAVRGLSSVDHMRGLYFVVHGMRLALSVGEPNRIARFGMFLAAQLRAIGVPGGTRLFDRYRTLALQANDPVLTTYVDYLEGYVLLQQGDPSAAARTLGRAVERFEQECRGVGWEISIALNMLCESVNERGDMSALAQLAGRAYTRARSLGDINGLQGAQGYLGLCALAQDDPNRARQHYDELLAMWTAEGFHYPHFIAGLCRNLCDLYDGNPAAAWGRTEEWLPQLSASGLDRAPYVRAKSLAHRAACGLSWLAAPEVPDVATANAIRKTVDRSVATLARLKRRDAAAEVAQLRAAMAALDGRGDEAADLLVSAGAAFKGLGLTHRMHICALRHCQITSASSEQVAAARDDIAALGVTDPDRWAAAYAPGFAR